MSAKNITTLFFLLALVSFSTCCGSVQAAAPPSTPPQPAPATSSNSTCTVERFYDGPTETVDYLQFASHACLITTAEDGTPAQDVNETYRLQFSHTVQAFDLQMGSNTGSAFEWAFWVDISTPDGHKFSLFNQYDKHVDNVGNRHEWRTLPVPITLPAGTTVTIRRPMLPDAYCTMAGPYGTTRGCATGQKVEMVGTLK